MAGVCNRDPRRSRGLAFLSLKIVVLTAIDSLGRDDCGIHWRLGEGVQLAGVIMLQLLK
jgi:hypothetical protein